MITTALAWLAVAIGAAAGAVLTMTLLGCLLSRQHVASRTILLPVPAATVWAALVDHPGQAAWRRGPLRVYRLPDRAGAEVWREHSGRHAVTFRTVAAEPTARLVRAIDDERSPFQGSWEFRLEPVISPANSRLTLIERGEVAAPLLRFVNRFVMGQATTVQNYLVDLAHKFGAEPRFIPSIEMQREVDAPPG